MRLGGVDWGGLGARSGLKDRFFGCFSSQKLSTWVFANGLGMI